MLFSRANSVHTRLLGLAALAASGLGFVASASAQLPATTLTFSQPIYTAGQTIVVTLTGAPGDVPVMFGGFNPGPTNVPGVGQLDVGFSANMLLLFLPAFDNSGSETLSCPTTCDFSALIGTPLFLQVVNLNLALHQPSGLSNPALLNLITGDCGQCVDEGVADPVVNGSGNSHALYLPGIGSDFVFVAGGQYTERADGTAHLLGEVERQSDPAQKLFVDVSFMGRIDPNDPGYPPAGSPKLELFPSAYADNGGPVHPETWHYFTASLGTLEGLGSLAGAHLTVQNVGPAFQVGDGANGKNTQHGASGWLHVVTVTQPTDTGIVLPAELQGDININIGGDCQNCARTPQDHALYLPGISTKLVFEPGALFTENQCGFATLTGIVHDSARTQHRFDVNIAYTNKVSPGGINYPPAGSPKKEHDPAQYKENGGLIDTDTWHYYLTTTGVLTGLDDYAGAVIELSRFGPAFQVGLGASAIGLDFGASGWLVVHITSQPTNGPALVLTSDHGDVNIHLGDCN